MRRERTNTPMQALLLMNDPQYVEAARGFAQRMLDEGGSGDDDRLRWALELATCAAPQAPDVADLGALLDEQRRVFRAAPAAAKALVTIGVHAPSGGVDAAELAAWTMVANVVLNLDAVLSKD